MIITSVKLLKNGRYGLFEGEEFILSVDRDTWADLDLHEGDELDEEGLEQLRTLVSRRRAHDKALTLLSYRDHSREELRRKLLRTADEEAAEEAADRMEELGLVDDERFARQLAAELYDRKLYGRNRVIYELQQRGIDRGAAQTVADEFDEEPAERALRYLEKKYPRNRADDGTRRRASAALSRCGYAWEDIRQALNNYGLDEKDAD